MGTSGRETARNIIRSKAVIFISFKNPKEHGKKKLTGNPQTFTISQKHEIVHSILLRKNLESFEFFSNENRNEFTKR